MQQMMSVLHFGVSHESVSVGEVALPGVLVLAGVASLAIVGLALAALAQRRSRSYLLITLALATLLARTVAGGLAMNGMVSVEIHHITEHALDGIMAILLLAAVYCARTTDPTTGGNRA